MTIRALLVAVVTVSPLVGQAEPAAPPEEGKPWLVSVASWGKFATLGMAAGFLALAAGSHAGAEDDYGALLSRCQAEPPLCTVGGNGSYLDPTSETLYQGTLDADAAARRWLVASQIALGASALLWIIDLTRGGGEPDNIPYVPLRVTVGQRETRVGLSFRF